jgi:hypothetical protein
MINMQLTPEEEYDINLLNAKRDLISSGLHKEYDEGDKDNVDEDFTKDDFFKDLKKASRKIKSKPSPKQSGT